MLTHVLRVILFCQNYFPCCTAFLSDVIDWYKSMPQIWNTFIWDIWFESFTRRKRVQLFHNRTVVLRHIYLDTCAINLPRLCAAAIPRKQKIFSKIFFFEAEIKMIIKTNDGFSMVHGSRSQFQTFSPSTMIRRRFDDFRQKFGDISMIFAKNLATLRWFSSSNIWRRFYGFRQKFGNVSMFFVKYLSTSRWFSSKIWRRFVKNLAIWKQNYGFICCFRVAYTLARMIQTQLNSLESWLNH
jgi:hypothetical protein